jgi:hypothetical protein
MEAQMAVCLAFKNGAITALNLHGMKHRKPA